ncbi:hypothetical protein E3G66_004672 [Mycobacteroides abscessus]|uniref:hypothetical protein n=1 Tax=Mycobacteroides abscessus TaxID=36809 RepID=UPI00092BAF9E|nr:hypothetical protein [Mycobacteroides abscessus]MBE5501845.1 hypothetical protein [Mycobacteroides abscessus]QOF40461.1 hypothetical protein E3G66_004672 [Mycobacteroides abscessus]SIM93182.1 Uncharacterised protein [Mycobacteroides abscessus subsp. bolletii]SLG98564.1 Uncharacterised protein [Mycobacteroides abscessus subsp. massiliense]
MTTQPFADQHAIIEAAQKRICATEEQVYAALARIPKPPGAITPDCHDEWRYCERAGAYVRDLTMRHWEVAGDGSGGVCAKVTLFVEQTDTGALREWSIYLDGRAVEEMTAQEARRLAAALLDAATALEAGQRHHADRDDHHLCDRDDHDPADADRDDHHPGGDTLEAGRPHTRKPVA